MPTKTALTVFLLSAAVLRAELKWETTRADLPAGPKDKVVETVFRFTNEGSAPVAIESVKSSCGCTTTALEKKTYGPGEKGELRARFEIGQRRGLQTKTIAVKVQNEPSPTILTLAVTIAEPLTLKPSLALWENGADGTARSLTLAAKPGQAIRSVKVVSSNPLFRAEVATVKEGESYSVVVTPGNTSTSAFATLTVEAEIGTSTQTLRGFAQVKAPAK